jgi:hypothetical protein
MCPLASSPHFDRGTAKVLAVAEAFLYHVLQFLLLLALIIGGAKLGGWLSLRARQPAVLGEIIAGVALGPSLLGTLPAVPGPWPARLALCPLPGRCQETRPDGHHGSLRADPGLASLPGRARPARSDRGATDPSQLPDGRAVSGGEAERDLEVDTVPLPHRLYI